MAVVLGIDLGTLSAKAMLFDTDTGVIGIASKSYSVHIPRPGQAEQSPEMWWASVLDALRRLQECAPGPYGQIQAVGLAGQMHGLVAVDKGGHVLRPAIIWLDQRSAKQARAVEKAFSTEDQGRLLHNRPFPGFAFSSLLWLKENEPSTFERIGSVMMPKDYIRLCLTGKIGTDYSDASASGAFNPGKREWCGEVLRHFGVGQGIFPPCGSAQQLAGVVTKEAAGHTGLQAGVPVVYGGGDQPVQGIGNGLVHERALICNIGTGGQITCYSETNRYDEKLRTQTFCHALPGAYTIFGATLCAGMSLDWLAENLLGEKDFRALDRQAGQVPPGSGGLVYLPYLSGERAPHMNTRARGMFFGMTLAMGRQHFARAVMEGVVYSLKDSLAILRRMGIGAKALIASGGGAKSPLWLQMQADILGMELKVSRVEEQACLGACILAALGAGVYANAAQACERHVSFHETSYRPNPRAGQVYEKAYKIYRELYDRTDDLMAACGHGNEEKNNEEGEQ